MRPYTDSSQDMVNNKRKINGSKTAIHYNSSQTGSRMRATMQARPMGSTEGGLTFTIRVRR